jgi:hypothetical protein
MPTPDRGEVWIVDLGMDQMVMVIRDRSGDFCPTV